MNLEGSFWRLDHLSDAELIQGLEGLAGRSRSVTAEIVAHRGELEERRLHLKAATPSLFAYCTERLGLSEDEACRRIDVARLARRFTAMFAMLADGELTLTVAALLKPYLTSDNHARVLSAVSGRSVAGAREALAALFPKPDAPSRIRKLPERHVEAVVPRGEAEAAGPKSRSPQTSATETGMTPGARNASIPPEPADAGAVSSDVATRSNTALQDEALTRELAGVPRTAARVEPLSEGRYRVQFTAGAELKKKLELARDLMRHGNPGGDLAVVVGRAVDLLLADLMKKRFGATARPTRGSDAKAGRVTNAVRRDVVLDQGLACSYVDEQGRRCGARAWLEHDHAIPKRQGGSSDVTNIRLLCRAHNQLEAERRYGRAHVEGAIARRRDNVSPPRGQTPPMPVRESAVRVFGLPALTRITSRLPAERPTGFRRVRRGCAGVP